MDHLNRLIARLHTPFDIEPQAVAVFRLSSGWSLRNHQLFIGADQFLASGKTIHELVNELEVRDYSVEPVRADLFQLDAGILMDGSGHAGQPISAFTSLLWAVKSAAGAAYKVAQDSIDAALSQLLLPQSTEEWADLFGQMFGIPREMGEPDGVYTARIIEEVKRARSNPFAISANIRRITGYDIEVREPWKEFFVLSETPMDQDFHIQGAPIWQYHTAQLIARSGVKWPAILREAYADRPVGTIYLDPATHYPPSQILTGDPDVTAWQEWLRSIRVWLLDGHVLSHNLSLSDTYVVLNHPFIVSELITMGGGPSGPLLGFGKPLTFCLGEIILSDQHPLDSNVNARFPGSYLREVGDPLSLSGDERLSDYQHGWVNEIVDAWEYRDDFLSAGLLTPIDGYLATESLRSAQVLVWSPGPWTGYWDGRTWDQSGTAQGRFGMYAELRVLQESGDPIILSDLGALSNYEHDLAYLDVPGIREQGMTTFNQRRVAVEVGDPLALSDAGGLSDYACGAEWFDVPEIKSAGYRIGTEVLLEDGEPIILSGGWGLSNYDNRLFAATPVETGNPLVLSDEGSFSDYSHHLEFMIQ